MPFVRFIATGLRGALTGGRRYWAWMGVLAVLFASGALAYLEQLRGGLAATSLDDHVPWGIYIANFTFLDGIAASTGLVLVAALVFRRKDAQRVALLGSGIAIAACVSCLLFVVVDVGRPLAAWHLVPVLGSLNWPRSMLAWDVVALNGYLVLSVLIPTHVLWRRFHGHRPPAQYIVPFVYLAIAWAVLIQVIIAFLYAANVGRPFWHSGLLGPRFLASSFTAGSCLMVLAFRWIGRHTRWPVQRSMVDLLAAIAGFALLANLFMLGMELFTELYHPTTHSASARYLFFGLDGHWGLVPWVWTAIGLQVLATVLLVLNRSRRNIWWLTVGCVAAIVGVWIEKGMGLVVPGFLPTSLGVIHEYVPNSVEVRVSLGIWALGLMIFSGLAKGALTILGLDGEPELHPSHAPPPPGRPIYGDELPDDENGVEAAAAPPAGTVPVRTDAAPAAHDAPDAGGEAPAAAEDAPEPGAAPQPA